MNYLQEYGKRMIDNGYRIVPIPAGYKWPKGFKDWQNFEATHQDVDAWVKQGVPGVAVLCEHTPAVDLDIPNMQLGGEMWKEVKRIAGEGPLRFGNRPKCLLPFKTLAPFGKMSSKKYVNPAENNLDITYQVEILGTGNEFVAYAIHKDTKKPYEWNEVQGDLFNVPRHKLPTLDRYKAQQIIDAFEAKIPSDWVEVSKSGKRNSPAFSHQTTELTGTVEGGGQPLPSADTFANMKTRWGGSMDQLRAILKEIDPTDYKMWVDAGFCIWHETDGSDAGFQLWDTWSQGAPEEYQKETDKERKAKWKTFDWKPKAEANQKFVTFKSLVFHAHGGALDDTKEVAGFLNRYFYVEAGKKVFDSTKQDKMEYAFLDLDEFHEARKNVIIMLPVAAPTEKDPLRMKDKNFFVSQEWQKHENRKSCHYLVYEPGQAVIHHVHDKIYQINTCHMPTFPMMEGGLDVWHDHMALLFPDEKDRHWMTAWVARKIQDPTDKCDVAPLLVAPEEGVGRSWLGGVMFKLLGYANCSRPEIKSLSIGNSFNSYMDDKLMCVIDEVYQRKSGQAEGKFEISSNLKSKISEKWAEVNVKNQATRTKRVYTDFLLMTNERDALSFTDSNRRIAVFIYDGMPRDAVYYRRLYGWRDAENGDGIAALWWYLKGYDVSGVDFQRAPKTKAKMSMIEEGKTSLEHAVDDFLFDPPFKVMTLDMVMDYLRNNSDLYDGLEAFKLTNQGQLLQIFRHHRGVTRYKSSTGSNQVRVGKKVYRPWILHKTISVDTEFVKREIEKQLS